MPSRLNDRDRRLLIATASFALVLIALTALVGRDATESAVPTTYSVDSGGAKAAYLLLRESGYPVRRWERSPTALATESPATLILAEPRDLPSSAEREAIAGFLRRGGRVIATGALVTLFVPEAHVMPDPIGAAIPSIATARAPSPITTAATQITLAPAAYWTGDSAAIALFGDEEARVVRYRVGAGEVIWWASSTPMTNAGITEPGNLAFLLACLGDRNVPVLWDEYFHGYRGASIAGAWSPFRLIAVPLVLVVAATLLTYARRSGPIVPLQQESRLSPLEFVRTLGGLYLSARGASIAVDVACSRFRYRLTHKLGLSSDSSIEEIERTTHARSPGRLVARGSVGDGKTAAGEEESLGALLRACEAARATPNLSPNAALRLTQRLGDFSAKLGLS